MRRYIGLNTNTDELPPVGEAVMLCTDASGTAAGQFKRDGLSGTTAGGFPHDLATMRLSEDDNHILAGRESSWTSEQD